MKEDKKPKTAATNDVADDDEAKIVAEASEDAKNAAGDPLPLPPKNRFAAFFRGYTGILGAVGALLAVAALVLIAVLMGGDIYDKAAFFWIVAFLAELGFYKLAHKSKGTLIAMIVTAALGVTFVVLYALELGGYLP